MAGAYPNWLLWRRRSLHGIEKYIHVKNRQIYTQNKSPSIQIITIVERGERGKEYCHYYKPVDCLQEMPQEIVVAMTANFFDGI